MKMINKSCRVMMTVMFLCSTVTVIAQGGKGYKETTITPMAGMTIANMTGENTDEFGWKPGFTAGIELMHRFNSYLGASLGAFYSQEGTKKKKSVYDAKLSMDYFNFPVLLNLYVVKGLALKSGIQLGVLTSCKQSAKEGSYGVTEDLKREFEYFDVTLPVGLSFEYSNVVVDARYHFGLKDVKSDGAIYNVMDLKNGFFSFVLGYRF